MSNTKKHIRDLVYSEQAVNQKLALTLAESQGVDIIDMIVEYCMRKWNDNVKYMLIDRLDDVLHSYYESLYECEFAGVKFSIGQMDYQLKFRYSKDSNKETYVCICDIDMLEYLNSIGVSLIDDYVSRGKSYLIYFIRVKLINIVKNE